MKENNHIIPAKREEIITDDGQAKYYFAEKYFNTDWHRITDSEIDLLMENHISDNIGKDSVSFGIFVFSFLTYLILLLLEVINFNAFNAIFIAFLVSLFIGVYTYFEDTLFVRSLEEADVCILPIYNLYMLRKQEKDKIKEYHYAEAFYGYELYKFNLTDDDIGATDIILVNIGKITKSFPVVIEDHLDRNGCSRGYTMYVNKSRLPF